jgi:hypothetical protein
VTCYPAFGAGGATRQCTQQDARKAEIEASTLKTWQQVFESYTHYRHCDDGAISEGYSSSVSELLSDHWDAVGELLLLLQSQPTFREFILRHLDDTMSPDQDQKIRANVRDRCPEHAAEFCALVKRRFVESDSARPAARAN